MTEDLTAVTKTLNPNYIATVQDVVITTSPQANSAKIVSRLGLDNVSYSGEGSTTFGKMRYEFWVASDDSSDASVSGQDIASTTVYYP